MAESPQQQMEALAELIDEHDQVVELLDRAAVMREASRRIRERTGLDLSYGAVQEGPDLLVIRGWSGAAGTSLRHLEVPRGLGLGGKAFALARPEWVPDYCTSAQITHHFDSVIRDEGIGAMVAVPLIHGTAVLGVLYGAQRATGVIGDTALRQMEIIAEPTATALHLSERLRLQSEVDLAAERRRIAIALHDSVGAMLFTLGAEVRDLQNADVDPDMLARLRRVEARIADTAAAFRESLAVLDVVRPDQALTATLRGDCEAFTRRTGVIARCVALTEIPELGRARHSAVVAVVREALVNVEKHAAATSVVVSIGSNERGLTIAVADDGLGWAEASGDPADLLYRQTTAAHSEMSNGMGLKASHDRLARLGGALSVVGNDDGGLTVRASIPTP